MNSGIGATCSNLGSSGLSFSRVLVRDFCYERKLHRLDWRIFESRREEIGFTLILDYQKGQFLVGTFWDSLTKV
jgi:hypothetical protein